MGKWPIPGILTSPDTTPLSPPSFAAPPRQWCAAPDIFVGGFNNRYKTVDPPAAWEENDTMRNLQLCTLRALQKCPTSALWYSSFKKNDLTLDFLDESFRLVTPQPKNYNHTFSNNLRISSLCTVHGTRCGHRAIERTTCGKRGGGWCWVAVKWLAVGENLRRQQLGEML